MGSTVIPADWTTAPDGSHTRPLVGGEILLSWMHHSRNGMGRIATGLDIETSLSVEELENRIGNAWMRTRLRHPLLGITFRMHPGGGSMDYSVLTKEFSQNWIRHSVIFMREDAGPLDTLLMSIDNYNTHPSDGHAKLYISFRKSGRHSIIINVSHALLDVFSIGVVWQTIIDELSKPADSPPVWRDQVANLPRPIANVIRESYPLSFFKYFGMVYSAIKSMRNVTADSIHVPLRPSIFGQPVGTDALLHIFTAEETSLFVARCKSSETTVTYALAAILALALKELFGEGYGEGSSKNNAQVFAMPYNGRRWLPKGLSPAAPESPSLGNSNAYIRIKHDSQSAPVGRRERVAWMRNFATKYKQKSLAVLENPIPTGLLASKTLVPWLVRFLEKGDPESPRSGVFSIVSQGHMDRLLPTKNSGPGDGVVKVVGYHNGGRCIDNNPIMLVYSWGGKMHLRFKWGTKYYERKTYETIMDKILDIFDDFVASDNESPFPSENSTVKDK